MTKPAKSTTAPKSTPTAATVTRSFVLTVEQSRAIDRLAAAQQRSASFIVRDLLASSISALPQGGTQS